MKGNTLPQNVREKKEAWTWKLGFTQKATGN